MEPVLRSSESSSAEVPNLITAIIHTRARTNPLTCAAHTAALPGGTRCQELRSPGSALSAPGRPLTTAAASRSDGTRRPRRGGRSPTRRRTPSTQHPTTHTIPVPHTPGAPLATPPLPAGRRCSAAGERSRLARPFIPVEAPGAAHDAVAPHPASALTTPALRTGEAGAAGARAFPVLLSPTPASRSTPRAHQPPHPLSNSPRPSGTRVPSRRGGSARRPPACPSRAPRTSARIAAGIACTAPACRG